MICLFFYSLFCTLAHQTWVAIVIATKPVYTSYFQEALGGSEGNLRVKWHKLNEKHRKFVFHYRAVGSKWELEKQETHIWVQLLQPQHKPLGHCLEMVTRFQQVKSRKPVEGESSGKAIEKSRFGWPQREGGVNFSGTMSWWWKCSHNKEDEHRCGGRSSQWGNGHTR